VKFAVICLVYFFKFICLRAIFIGILACFFDFRSFQYSKKINGLLNIVVTITTNLKKNKKSRKINFSTDTKQSYEKILDYYSLRFQVEFSFRDAKQFFGLEDFMNIKKIRIHNFANLSLFMNNITYLYYENSHF